MLLNIAHTPLYGPRNAILHLYVSLDRPPRSKKLSTHFLHIQNRVPLGNSLDTAVLYVELSQYAFRAHESICLNLLSSYRTQSVVYEILDSQMRKFPPID